VSGRAAAAGRAPRRRAPAPERGRRSADRASTVLTRHAARARGRDRLAPDVVLWAGRGARTSACAACKASASRPAPRAWPGQQASARRSRRRGGRRRPRAHAPARPLHIRGRGRGRNQASRAPAAPHLHVAGGEHALGAGGGAVGRGDDVAGVVQLQLAVQETRGGLVAWGCVGRWAGGWRRAAVGWRRGAARPFGRRRLGVRGRSAPGLRGAGRPPSFRAARAHRWRRTGR
jgi:hypothetical protein